MGYEATPCNTRAGGAKYIYDWDAMRPWVKTRTGVDIDKAEENSTGK